MVTIPEYQQQLQQRRQVLKQSSQQLRSAQPSFSQQQLRTTGISQRQKDISKFESERQKGLSQIEAEFQKQQQLEAEFAPQLARFEKFKQLEREQAAFETGRKIALKGAPPIGLGALERKGFVAGVQEIKAAESRKKNIADFKKQIEEFETQTGSKVKFKAGSLEIAGIESETLGRSIPIEQYNKLVELEQQKISPELMSLQSPQQEPLAVLPSPTLKQQFKDITAREGLISGSLSFVSGKAGEGADYLAQRGGVAGEPFKGQGSIKPSTVETITRTGPYFVPYLGGSLMITEGTETYATGAGRERLTQTAEGLQEEYKIPQAVTYLLPAGQIILGAGVLKGDISRGIAKRELRAFEETPTIIKGTRYEMGDKGVDILTGIKQTPKTTYKTTIQQPFYQVGDDMVILEGGKGISVKYQDVPIGFTSFEVGGRFQRVQTTPKSIKTIIKKPYLFDQRTVTSQLPELEAGVGRLYVKKIKEGEIGLVFPTGAKKYKIIKPKEPYTREYEGFLGLAKEKDGKIAVVGAKAEKGRLYKDTGKVSVTGKPSSVGIIERPTTDEPFKMFFGRSGKKTPFETQISQVKIAQPTYAQPIIEKGLLGIQPTVPSPSYVGGMGGVASQSLYFGKGVGAEETQFIRPTITGGAILETPTINTFTPTIITQPTTISPTQFDLVKPTQLFFQSSISKQPQLELQKERVEERLRQDTLTIQQPRERIREAVRTRQRVFQRQRLRQRLLQRPRPTTATSQYVRTPPTRGKFFWLGGGKGEVKTKPAKTLKTDSKFITELKRRGKWFEIGKRADYLKALTLGKFATRETLAASFRVRKGKELVKLKPSKFFRAGKSGRDPFTLVQRKRKVGGMGSRLGTRGELFEIMKARNKIKYL